MESIFKAMANLCCDSYYCFRETNKQRELYGSSVGTVRVICFRGSGNPVVQDKTTLHAKPIYVFIYTKSMNVCNANPRIT